VVITTALVPGRKAPTLVTAAAVQGMKAGSVVVDLAGESGGNCELTEPGQIVVKTRRDDRVAAEPAGDHARARQRAVLAEYLVAARVDDRREGRLVPDYSDEVLAKSCVAGKPSADAGTGDEGTGGES